MKTVVITGVGQGIGCALAKKFLEEGWRVIGTTTDAACAFSHVNLEIVALDLASPESIAACVRAIEGRGMSIDVFINNAGVLLDEDDTTLIPEKLRKTLEINLIGTADFTERLIPLVLKDGHILFVSSSAGSLDYTGQLKSHFPLHYPAYKISKAALNMYMKTLSTRFKDSGPRVSSVHPGWVRTAMGGDNAPMAPEEAADDIYALATSSVKTGGFWHKGELLPW